VCIQNFDKNMEVKYMKQCLLIVCVITMIVGVAGMAQALPVRIHDNFIGEDDHGRGDVIGDVNVFGIDWMDVDIVGTTMTVDIKTPFDPANPGALGTDYGDLFISVDGYTPETEDWEYVFDVSSGNLYDIRAAQDQILLSDDFIGPGYIYRNGQEVQIDPTGLTALSTADEDGNSAIRNPEYYSLSFDISGMGLTSGMELGFHWAMTCGNDTIEGAYTPVPEPTTLLLLGVGLVGVFTVAKKRIK
jgi:hypothetical protein